MKRAIVAALLAACSPSPAGAPLRLDPYPPQHVERPALGVPAAALPLLPAQAIVPALAVATCPVQPAAGDRLELPLGSERLELPAGRWAVEVELPAEGYVTVGVLGPRDALVSLRVAGAGGIRRVGAPGVLEDDGKLPAFVSFEMEGEPAPLMVVADAVEPVALVRVASAPVDARLEIGVTPALIGLPFALDARAGYELAVPHRYQFVRADVAAALRGALEQTRTRFRRNAIAVGDLSQWNGDRPASDLGRARHISHVGGRDVDLALPSSADGPSRIESRCRGVLVERDVLSCAPGTVEGLDAERLGYLLGLLLDGPTPGGRHVPDAKRRDGPIVEVETIFTDQAYIDELRRALPSLRRKKWIHEEAFATLIEDGLLRPSPWHVDHVHVRFSGGAASPARALLGGPPCTNGSDEVPLQAITAPLGGAQ